MSLLNTIDSAFLAIRSAADAVTERERMRVHRDWMDVREGIWDTIIKIDNELRKSNTDYDTVRILLAKLRYNTDTLGRENLPTTILDAQKRLTDTYEGRGVYSTVGGNVATPRRSEPSSDDGGDANDQHIHTPTVIPKEIVEDYLNSQDEFEDDEILKQIEVEHESILADARSAAEQAATQPSVIERIADEITLRKPKPRYEVKFFTGDYSERQAEANAWGAHFYFEQHLNSSSNQTAKYAMAIVAKNASQKSVAMAEEYVRQCNERMKCGIMSDNTSSEDPVKNGVRHGGRGCGSIYRTDMPAFLGEPTFVSNPDMAVFAKSERGQRVMAELLVNLIQEFYPNGAKVAFSIGHKGKRSKPTDMGTAVHGGGWEADIAEGILIEAKEKLTA